MMALPLSRWAMVVLFVCQALQTLGDGGIRLPDQLSTDESEEARSVPQNQQSQGRSLLDWVGLGESNDPYEYRTTQSCLNGDLADCFKAQALRSFDEFFQRDSYSLGENARILKSEELARSIQNAPSEFSSREASSDSDWDELVKFGLRKIERFLRSTTLELNFDDEVTLGGALQPRFIDEIADEIDVLEDKKAPLFKRNKLKKFFIPMLLILKLFKLKLLLFLPLILGLASFKKFLGFMALIIPGIIGYFKLCKPNLQASYGNHYGGPQYSPAGVGLGPGIYREPPHFIQQQSYGGNHYNGDYRGHGHGGGIAFRDEEGPAQDLAYQGWEYRSKKPEDEIKSEA